MNYNTKQNIILLLLFPALAIQLARHVNDFYIPESDFFDYQEKAVQLSRLESPDNFKRPPLFPVAIAVFSVPFTGKYQQLYAAELIVALSALFSLFFLYRISFKFLGIHAFWITLLFAMHPTTLRMAVKPKPEMFVTFFILWAFERFLAGDRKSYILAFLASMVRYEGALLIVAFFVVDFFRNNQRIKSLLYSILAGLPLVLWTVLHQDGSDGASYGNYFNSYSINMSYIKTLWQGLIAFMPVHYFKVWFVIALLLFIVGIVVGLKKHRPATFSLLLFILGFIVMHTIWPFNNIDYLVIVAWSFFLIIGIALADLSRLVLIRYSLNKKSVLIAGAVILLAVILLTSTHTFQFPQYEPNLLALILFLIPAGLFLYVYSKASVLFPLKLYPFVLSVVILLAFWLNSKTNADLFDIRYSKAEYRKAGEWFEQIYKTGDKMAIAQPTVVAYFTNLDKDKDFLRITELPDVIPAELNSWLIENKVNYIAWLSTNKVRENVDAWESWKRDNRGWQQIKFLEQGASQPGFELVHEIKVGPRWGYIYKIL